MSSPNKPFAASQTTKNIITIAITLALLLLENLGLSFS